MKKIALIVFLLMIVGFIGLVYSQSDMPSTGFQSSEQDVQTITNITSKLPVNDSGLDFTKLNLTNTSAQARLDAINLWLSENAEWMSIVFCMVPEISWLFVINLFLILDAFVILVLNGKFFLTRVMSKGLAQIFGLLIFIILIVMKYPFYAARAIITSFEYWWAFALFIIALIGLAVLSSYLAKYSEKKLEEYLKRQAELNQKILQKTVEGISGE